jgi:hypothetical protein
MAKRMALIVGINDYGEASDLETLHYAEADADAINETLKHVSNFNTQLILGKQATRSEIIKTLGTFYPEKDIDLFMFYFAGHGELIQEIGMHCLHCYGSQFGDTIDTLNLAEWANRIKRNISADQIVLVVDACRNKVYRGMSERGSSAGLNSSVRTALSEISNIPGDVQVNHNVAKVKPKLLYTLLSSGVGQVSYEDYELKHGIFSYALIEEIKKNGKKLPLSQLRKRIGDFTYNRCKRKKWSPEQIPEWIEPSLSGEVYLLDISEESNRIDLPDYDQHIGKAISNILKAFPSPYGTRGYVRRYEKGSLYLITKVGKPKLEWAKIEKGMSFRVYDSPPIGVRYETMGGSRSELGFPVWEMNDAWGSQKGIWKSRGLVQFFEGGNIYFCQRYGAHSLLTGKIRDMISNSEKEVKISDKIENTKLTGGLFGFPISEEMIIVSSTRAVGNVQRFEYGLIIDWSGGVYGIVKGFYDLYQSLVEWNSDLGFPMSDEIPITSSISQIAGSIQYFENGCMVWNINTDEYLFIAGLIFLEWKEKKDKYGFPINNPYHVEDGFEQLFEGGEISTDIDLYLNPSHIRPDHQNQIFIKGKKLAAETDKFIEKKYKNNAQKTSIGFGFSKKQLNTLHTLYDRFGHIFSSSLSAYLRASIDIRLSSIEEMPYSTFIFSLPDPTYFNAISISPLEGISILEINLEILFPMINKILGVKSEEFTSGMRTITDIERTLIQGIINLALRDLTEAWRPINKFKLSVVLDPIRKG